MRHEVEYLYIAPNGQRLRFERLSPALWLCQTTGGAIARVEAGTQTLAVADKERLPYPDAAVDFGGDVYFDEELDVFDEPTVVSRPRASVLVGGAKVVAA